MTVEMFEAINHVGLFVHMFLYTLMGVMWFFEYTPETDGYWEEKGALQYWLAFEAELDAQYVAVDDLAEMKAILDAAIAEQDQEMCRKLDACVTKVLKRKEMCHKLDSCVTKVMAAKVKRIDVHHAPLQLAA
jgi:hypothetical protein